MLALHIPLRLSHLKEKNILYIYIHISLKKYDSSAKLGYNFVCIKCKY